MAGGLAATETGDPGSGRTVVLLHAFPCRREMWDGQLGPIAAAGWHALAPDLPGFGQSPLSPEEPDLDVMADAVLALLDERGIDRFVVGGLSMGGYVAMALLRRAGARVDAVMLMDTKAGADPQGARENRFRVADLVEEQGSAASLTTTLIPNLLGDATKADRPEVVALVDSWAESADPAGIAWAQRAMAGRPDSVATLRGFTGPALVVMGDEDEVSPQHDQDVMVEALTDSTFIVIEGAGHLSAVEQADQVAAAIVTFLAGLPVTPSGPPPNTSA